MAWIFVLSKHELYMQAKPSNSALTEGEAITVEWVGVIHNREHASRLIEEALESLQEGDRLWLGVSVPPIDDADSGSGEWSEDKNARRCELIDKDIQGEITVAEKAKLNRLQQQFHEHIDAVSPRPIKGVTKLHKELLKKKREHERRG